MSQVVLLSRDSFTLVGDPSISFGEGHLDVIKVAYCPWDGQMHQAEFSNEALKLLTGHTVLGRGNIQEGVKVRNAFG